MSKKKLVQQFTAASTPLRLIFAISAFGMGVNCCDVNKIIHIGVPEDTELYIQGTELDVLVNHLWLYFYSMQEVMHLLMKTQWSRNRGGRGGHVPPQYYYWGALPPQYILKLSYMHYIAICKLVVRRV